MDTWLIPLPAWTLAAAACVALAVDRWWGEPQARWHPVVWMGWLLSKAGPWCAPSVSQLPVRTVRPFLAGMLAWCLGAALVVSVAWGVQWGLATLASAWSPFWAGCGLAAVLGVLLKPLLAWRMLREEVAAVEQALSQSLPQGRERLAWLCSRDVSQLSAEQVRETALETLAENLNDSVVAPLFWFLLAGLPGAVLYRWANTADAMWGYRGERQGRDWTWAGKWAARVDDVLSWVPARVTGLLLMLLGRSLAWRRWYREAGHTPSPNGGWPMAALALALGVRLGKPGVYVLNAAGAAPLPHHVHQALRLTHFTVNSLLGLLSLTALGLLRGAQP